jgi:hypothetical protein
LGIYGWALINRTIEPTSHTLAGKYPVVTITGPRQSGKTTLCRKVFPHKPYANLESPDTRQFAIDDPRGFLARYPDGAVFDEIQIEIKAGMSITRDYFKGLHYVAKIFPDHMPRGGGIVYAGADIQQRTDVSIFPFQHIGDLFNLTRLIWARL